MSTVNVALIGYAFMGKAHSNAYRQVSRFFRPRLDPRMRVICGRTKASVVAAARAFGWEEAATDWPSVVTRKDVDIVTSIAAERGADAGALAALAEAVLTRMGHPKS